MLSRSVLLPVVALFSLSLSPLANAQKFRAGRLITVSPTPASSVFGQVYGIADFNGDDRPDFLGAANNAEGANVADVMLQNSDGTLWNTPLRIAVIYIDRSRNGGGNVGLPVDGPPPLPYDILKAFSRPAGDYKRRALMNIEPVSSDDPSAIATGHEPKYSSADISTELDMVIFPENIPPCHSPACVIYAVFMNFGEDQDTVTYSMWDSGVDIDVEGAAPLAAFVSLDDLSVRNEVLCQFAELACSFGYRNTTILLHLNGDQLNRYITLYDGPLSDPEQVAIAA